jgi:hypothetical protein
MYVTGSISQVYPNGRIVYEGQGDVLPDGSSECGHTHRHIVSFSERQQGSAAALTSILSPPRTLHCT